MAVLPFAIAPVRLGLTLTVAATLGWFAIGLAGVERRLMLIGSLSVLTLVLYRFAQQSIPAVWMLSDMVGGGLGRLAATAVGRPLAVGASFAGLDILVVMFVFCVGWVTMLRGPRWSAMAFAAAAVLTVHFVYLTILALTHDIAQLAARGNTHREQSVRSTSVQLARDRAAAASLESARAGSSVPDCAGGHARALRIVPPVWERGGSECLVGGRASCDSRGCRDGMSGGGRALAGHAPHGGQFGWEDDRRHRTRPTGLGKAAA